MIKISHYFSTIDITKGLFVAILLSLFIYLEHFGYSIFIVITIFALLGLYLLIDSEAKVWFWSGFFISMLWFWWIMLSFKIYQIAWVMPFGLIGIGLLYGLMFLILYKIAQLISSKTKIPIVFLLAICLFTISYIHPFGFDWLKLEIIFHNSYLGTSWWQFGLILFAIALAQYRQNLLFLFLVFLAYSPTAYTTNTNINPSIKVTTTNIPIDVKWQEESSQLILQQIFQTIDDGINDGYDLIVFPESTLTMFLNYETAILEVLQEKSQKITIVIGALFWDDGIPRNSTYIFNNNTISVAHKYILVPFGEYNPLPKWIGEWINKIIYDGGADYIASETMSEYKIDGVIYRNAICYEATSKKLYKDNPKNMIAISNNGWFVPSTEPTLQRLLLEHYSKQHGTTIYHSVNMSPSYIVANGKTVFIK
ncbi:MAG TPA: apolipoprotein N-acyltransferase [Epsilonproteobacteria bacterium]|nr:apolipoprotein N-acyltransferase [Campylobacterota bacterium]